MPAWGRSEAALTAYPELSCDPAMQYKVSGMGRVFFTIFIVLRIRHLIFLQDVLTEVMELFLSKYIHIGGDRGAKDAWKKSEFLPEADEAAGPENRTGKVILYKGLKFMQTQKGAVLWLGQRILEGGLSPNARPY